MINKNPSLLSLLCTMIAFHGITIAEIPYETAILDAKEALPSEVKELNPITTENPTLIWNNNKKSHVLVTSYVPEWVIQDIYTDKNTKNLNKTITAPDNDDDGFPRMWVSPAPELKNFIEALNSEERKNPQYLKKKIIQFLGLHPKMIDDNTNRELVEMWIKPQDILRPCIDIDPSDKYCNVDSIEAKADFNKAESIPVSYAQAYITRKSKVYTGDWAFPWTRLGYTYNWGTESDDVHGASEYIVKPGATIHLEKVIKPVEYPEIDHESYNRSIQ